MKDAKKGIKSVLFMTAFLLSGLIIYTSLSDVRAESQSLTTDVSATASPDSIQDMIATQLRAFREKDADIAYDAVSPDLQSRYKNAKTFLMMMRYTHQPLTSHVSYSFLDRMRIGESLIQKVEMTNKDGSSTIVLFKLVHDDDGLWRIDGYTVLDNDAQPI